MQLHLTDFFGIHYTRCWHSSHTFWRSLRCFLRFRSNVETVSHVLASASKLAKDWDAISLQFFGDSIQAWSRISAKLSWWQHRMDGSESILTPPSKKYKYAVRISSQWISHWINIIHYGDSKFRPICCRNSNNRMKWCRINIIHCWVKPHPNWVTADSWVPCHVFQLLGLLWLGAASTAIVKPEEPVHCPKRSSHAIIVSCITWNSLIWKKHLDQKSPRTGDELSTSVALAIMRLQSCKSFFTESICGAACVCW